MRAFVGVVTVLLICAMQSSIAHFMSIGSVKPDFVLVFVVAMGLLYGHTTGLIIGFFCGLILDLLGIGMFGFYTFCLVIVGMFSGSAQKSVFEDSYLLPVLVVAGSSFVIQILWNVCLWFGGYRFTSFTMLILLLLAQVIYNVVITTPLFFLFKRIKKLVK